jgi:2-polyprenyl-3-methyl-5-hydroxy-6-metoxy-1,4-benzoquinol methylase
MSTKFKKEVLEAFQKVSPSAIGVEDEQELKKYTENHYNLFHNKLKFPIKMFKDSKVLNFGCGTGEVDLVLANWGAFVEGFDFNNISINRANSLRTLFNLEDKLSFSVGDVDEYEFQKESFDIVISMGVIAHVPNQENMFKRMVQACKKNGFITLGYVESSGLIQRLLHRAICNINDDGNEQKVYDIANNLFSEHIKRSVKYGGRTAKSVINDYLVNPHYVGISVKTLFEWMDKYGLEYYSMTPNIELPFTVDSPYHKSLVANTDLYKKYLTILELRWIFGQSEDKDIFNEILEPLSILEKTIDSVLGNVDEILQNFKYKKKYLDKIEEDMNKIDIEMKNSLSNMSQYISNNFKELKDEFIKILGMIVKKVENNEEFDLTYKSNKLFKGYNGLTTNYIMFHKKV